jgi:hypothetical protein
MLRKIVIYIAVICLLAVLAIKSPWALHHSGLLGSCSVYARASDGSEMEQCRSGKLDGLPDLSGKGCTLQTIGSAVEYWSCPTAIGSAPAGI